MRDNEKVEEQSGVSLLCWPSHTVRRGILKRLSPNTFRHTLKVLTGGHSVRAEGEGIGGRTGGQIRHYPLPLKTAFSCLIDYHWHMRKALQYRLNPTMERDCGARQSAEQHLTGCGCLDY